MTDEAPPASRLAASLWGLLIVGCLLGSGGVGWLAMRAEAHGRDIEAHWRLVEARVVDGHSGTEPASRQNSYWATLEYTDEEGNDHQFQPQASSYAYDEETYEIYYHRNTRTKHPGLRSTATCGL